MSEIVLPATRSSPLQRVRFIPIALTALLTLYAFSRVLEVLPTSSPSTPIVALEILSALAFALIHGAQHYRLGGILTFATITFVMGNLIESVGVLTGFPFGHYEFLPLMGPQLNHIPILLGLAYIGMAYAAWTLARLILHATAPPRGSQLISLPILAALIMTAWDFAQDPVWSTLLHAWRWRDGGPWFGVPLINYAGWLLTVFLIYLAFALYLRRSVVSPAPIRPYWRAAILLYTFCAIGNALQLLRTQTADLIADQTGTLWHTATILRASAMVSIFIMGSFVVVASLNLRKRDDSETGAESSQQP